MTTFPRRLKWLVLAALLGRLHSTATNLAIGLAVHAWTGSYALAGAVIGALALGNGLSAPLRGRSVDRDAVATVLRCGLGYTLALSALGGITLAADRAWWPVAVAIALAAGSLLPPVAPAFRAALPRLTTSTAQVTRVLTWEATLQELIFISGPPAIVAVAAMAGTSSSVVVVAAVTGLGSVTFGIALHRTRGWPAGDEDAPTMDAGQGGASKSPDIDPRVRSALVRLALAYGNLLAALTTMTLIAIHAAVRSGHPSAAAWLEASIAAGSMLGGGLASRGLLDRMHLSARLAGMAAALGGLVAVTATSTSLPLTALSLATAGLWIAPSLALHSAAVLEAAPDDRRAEAFGWVNAAGMATNAAWTPVAGFVLDRAGAKGGAALAAVAVVVASAAVAGLVDTNATATSA